MSKFSLKRRLQKIKIFYFLFVNKRLRKSKFTNELLSNSWLIVDKFTYGKPEILVFPGNNNSKVFIGKFCSIAKNVEIFAGGNHNINWITTYPFGQFGDHFSNGTEIPDCSSSKGEVHIGNDVWIGRGVTIMSGVKIGDGAVIGANCLVASDVEPYLIVVGNPMKKLRKRFSDDTIKKLLSIKWWDWDKEKINNEIQLLCSDNLDKFTDKHYKC